MSQQDGSSPPNPPQQPAPRRGNPLLPGGWIAIIVLGVVAFAFLAFGNRYREINISDFNELKNAGELKSVTLVGSDRAEGEVRDPNSELAKHLQLGKELCDRLPEKLRKLHDAFGTQQASGSLFEVMKDLLAIRNEVRR